MIGARRVLPVLTATGHHDVAYKVATQITEPSWGYWTDTLKFTSLGESWPADTRSRNHHFFGAIVQWFYEDLAGIRPILPGFREIAIKPQIPAVGLDHVSASYKSVRGTIKSTWNRTASGLELGVVVPPNVRASVYVPATKQAEVTIDGVEKDAVKFVRIEGGRVVYEVGSGKYRFRVDKQIR